MTDDGGTRYYFCEKCKKAVGGPTCEDKDNPKRQYHWGSDGMACGPVVVR